MILWTIQPLKVYNSIINGTIYKSDGRYINKNFKQPYSWMTEKMKEKIGKPPKGTRYPIWAWYKYDSKRKKPDLRNCGFGKQGEKMVCIEIDIPDNEVLLSDFDAWHFVLNNCYYDFKCKNEEQFNETYKWIESLPKEEKQKEIEKSWDNIFNITEDNGEWSKNGHWVQATFWTLKRENIKKTWFFTAR